MKRVHRIFDNIELRQLQCGPEQFMRPQNVLVVVGPGFSEEVEMFLANAQCCAFVVMRDTIAVLAILTSFLSGSVLSAEPSSAPLGFFEAIEFQAVDAKLIQRDAKQGTLIVTNLRREPLKLAMPRAFAGLPVLAQFDNLAQGNRNGNQGQAPQAVGFGFPRGNNQGGNGGNRGPFNFFNNRRAFNNGFFNLPPGKTVRLRLPCLCLEYGKPDPRPQHMYQVRPLEDFTKDTQVRDLLVEFTKNQTRQQVAQLAVWHLTGDLSWQRMESDWTRNISGVRKKRFRTRDIEQAKRLVDLVVRRRIDAPQSSQLASAQ